MKPIFGLLFLALSVSSMGQSYHKFLETDKTWVVSYTDYISMPPSSYTISYTYQKDTVINGTLYKDYGAIVREDTANQTVFMWDGNQEHMLYDFNAKVGDTLRVPHFEIVIDSIATVTLGNNEDRSIFYHSGSETGEYYIEGIGSNHGFIEISEALGPPQISFDCLTVDEEKIFGACATSSISDKGTSTRHVLIYPNPANDIIKLPVPKESEFLKIQIRNQYGQLVKETSFSPEVHVNRLAAGLYFLKFLNKANQPIGVSKFVKE